MLTQIAKLVHLISSYRDVRNMNWSVRRFIIMLDVQCWQLEFEQKTEEQRSRSSPEASSTSGSWDLDLVLPSSTWVSSRGEIGVWRECWWHRIRYSLRRGCSLFLEAIFMTGNYQKPFWYFPLHVSRFWWPVSFDLVLDVNRFKIRLSLGSFSCCFFFSRILSLRLIHHAFRHR